MTSGIVEGMAKRYRQWVTEDYQGRIVHAPYKWWIRSTEDLQGLGRYVKKMIPPPEGW